MYRALIDILNTNLPAAALHGGRIAPGRRAGTLPEIVYSEISGDRQLDEGLEEGVKVSVYQLDCWANGYVQARELGKAVKDALQGFSGVSAAQKVLLIDLTRKHDDYDEGENLHRVVMDFEFYHY